MGQCFRQVSGDSVPYYFSIDPEIRMDKTISHARGFLPIKPGACILDSPGQEICRFADNFYVSDNGIKCLAVFKERIILKPLNIRWKSWR